LAARTREEKRERGGETAVLPETNAPDAFLESNILESSKGMISSEIKILLLNLHVFSMKETGSVKRK